ncbi:helix-turn-helix domain-containing protein [Longimycelium tulufanense]|uniref:helix-turn-helix domain-containing protein n=1 Tax=Longimycelium tulufanense TaxID=907463 RepID=UPI003570DDBF
MTGRPCISSASHRATRSETAVAARVGVSRGTAAKWRSRFQRDRLNGLSEEPRPGVPRTITDA